MIRICVYAGAILAAVAGAALIRSSPAQDAAAGTNGGQQVAGQKPRAEAKVGRIVKGKIVPPKELAGMKAAPESFAHLIMPVALPAVSLPENILRLTPEERLEWYNTWEKTELGRQHAIARMERRQIRSLDTPLGKDGTFAFSDAPPGKSFVEVEFYAANEGGGANNEKLLAVAAYELNLPLLEGNAAGTVNVGALEARKLETINAGQRAPNIVFEMQKGVGQLADHKGKVVVLDFWGAWCGSCRQQMPELRGIYAKFASDPHFAMVSLSDGDQREDWEEAVRKEKMTWTQGILGTHEEAWQAKMYATVRYRHTG